MSRRDFLRVCMSSAVVGVSAGYAYGAGRESLLPGRKALSEQGAAGVGSRVQAASGESPACPSGFGSGDYCYQVATGWGKLPEGWTWGCTPAVACDSKDRVYVHSRSEHPIMIFDGEGNFLACWGQGIHKNPHGISVDAQGNVFSVDQNNHCVYKFNPEGKLVLTLGTPGRPAEKAGEPFNEPTDASVAPSGEIFVSDGYKNSRVHKFSPDGRLIMSWGEEGKGPGQFTVPHCVRIAPDGGVWVCDRKNDRIQIFDQDGKFISQWTGLHEPCCLHFDAKADAVYVAEFAQRVSIFRRDGTLVCSWGGGRKSDKPGEFLGGPHGICADSRGNLYVAEAPLQARLQKFIRQR